MGLRGFLTPLPSVSLVPAGVPGDVRRLDVPSAQVEFDDRDEAFGRVVYRRGGKECLRMLHKTTPLLAPGWDPSEGPYFVIRSSIDRGSSIKVGRVILLRSAPGRSWEMMDKRTGKRQSRVWISKVPRDASTYCSSLHRPPPSHRRSSLLHRQLMSDGLVGDTSVQRLKNNQSPPLAWATESLK